MLEFGCVVDGKYKILQEIGRGGTSIVYLALNERVNKNWAIKEIQREFCINYELVRQKLISETNILKRLDHPNLPRIIDVIEYKNSILIVMDYIEGKSLQHLLDVHGAFDEISVMKWGIQICEVLYYLHSSKPSIIYGDLKPSNLILKADGRIMLIDFGTAKEYQMDGYENLECLGTRGFAAPEQYRGKEKMDARTDIFSFGVTLRYLLTGESPRKPAYTSFSALYNRTVLSDGIYKIIEKCTQISPQNRFQNCLELSYALKNIQENEKKQKEKMWKKIYIFCLFSFVFLLFLGAGFLCHITCMMNKQEAVMAYIKQAETAVEEKYIKENYERALRIEPGESKIYESLTSCYIRQNDFNMESAAELMNILDSVSGQISSLKKFQNQNPEKYCQFCYSVGIGYFYYMGDITGKKEAQIWFQEVLDTKGNKKKKIFSEEKRKRAAIYRDISRYYNTFLGNGKDTSGEKNSEGYLEFYKTLHKLNQFNLKENSSDSEVEIAYFISKEIAIAIRNYTQEFLKEKISNTLLKKELEKIYSSNGRKCRIDFLMQKKEKTEIEELKELVIDANRRLIIAEGILEKEGDNSNAH